MKPEPETDGMPLVAKRGRPPVLIRCGWCFEKAIADDLPIPVLMSMVGLRSHLRVCPNRPRKDGK